MLHTATEKYISQEIPTSQFLTLQLTQGAFFFFGYRERNRPLIKSKWTCTFVRAEATVCVQ